MKSFYVAGARAAEHLEAYPGTLVELPNRRGSSVAAYGRVPHARVAHKGPSSARIAVYDGPSSAPRIEEVVAESVGDLLEEIAARVYENARAMGGAVPYSVIREVAENFIHAEFREPVVSVLDRGNTVRFSDQGPGFSDSGRAIEPGYTTATSEMKRYIRGVGSGLPLARECLAFSGGSLSIEANLGCGAVVTVAVPGERGAGPAKREAAPSTPRHAAVPAGAQQPSAGETRLPEATGTLLSSVAADAAAPAGHRLTNRQKQVLALVMDTGAAGPSIVAKELSVGLSTAYRDLARLESLGLIVSDDTGKREITEEGTAYLGGLLNGLF